MGDADMDDMGGIDKKADMGDMNAIGE